MRENAESLHLSHAPPTLLPLGSWRRLAGLKGREILASEKKERKMASHMNCVEVSPSVFVRERFVCLVEVSLCGRTQKDVCQPPLSAASYGKLDGKPKS